MGINKARDYKRTTLRRLDTLSGNQCASPDCTRQLLARDGETIVSKICHIEAASADGPRYNPDMTDDERRHYDNLILLCDECHCIIDNKDNEADYPVELLQAWKTEHEAKNRNPTLSTSLLNSVVRALANVDFDDESPGENTRGPAFDISKKIAHNSVRRNKALLDEYKVYYSRLAALYAELEAQGSFRKANLLRNIRTIYLRVKGKYLGDRSDSIDLLQKHADDIVEDIQDELYDVACDGMPASNEDVDFGVAVVMVDAFMRCKILEEPPQP